MRYYSTQRPVGPGTFPKLPENKVLEVHNFDAKTFCEEIGREAWGYIDFESPLTQEQADNYELIAPGVGCTGCVNETASRDMDCCWHCSRNRRSKKDLYRRRPAGGCSRDRLCKDPHGTGRRTGRLPVRIRRHDPAQALHRAIEAVKECQDCAAEAGRMAKEVSRHDMA